MNEDRMNDFADGKRCGLGTKQRELTQANNADNFFGTGCQVVVGVHGEALAVRLLPLVQHHVQLLLYGDGEDLEVDRRHERPDHPAVERVPLAAWQPYQAVLHAAVEARGAAGRERVPVSQQLLDHVWVANPYNQLDLNVEQGQGVRKSGSVR